VVIYGHDAKAGLQVDLEADISAYDPSSSSRRKGRKPKHSNRNDNVKGNGNGDGSPEVMEDRENEENEEQQQQRKKKEREKGKQETGLRYAFGLDSGCGHGRQLSALVVEAGPAGVSHTVVQVDCSEVDRRKGKGKGKKGAERG
jgi:hypothetical protein